MFENDPLLTSGRNLEQLAQENVLYHAIARDEDHVRELAEEAGINLEGLTIDLERSNVKDQMGRSYSAMIEDAVVR